MGWKDIPTGEGSKNFIKIKSGDSADVIFMGEPRTYYQIFGDKMQYMQKVDGSSFKFEIQVVVKEDNQYVGKVLQGGYFLISDIKAQIDENGERGIYRIKRQGEKTATRYFVIYKGPVTDEQWESLKSVKLPDISSMAKGRETKQMTIAPSGDFEDNDIPF